MTREKAKKAVIGTITVNPSIDQHIAIDRLVKDDAIRAREERRDPGGKGINVSRVIRELGGRTVAFGVSGGCAGYMLKSLMADACIPFEALEAAEETRINVILTDLSDRTQTRISAAGPRLSLAETDRFIDKILGYKPLPRWWVLGGTTPPGVPADLYARLIGRLRERGARCLLDSDGETLRLGIQATPYLIKPNEYELERLAGKTLANEESFLNAAHEIALGGVEIVAVTLGRKGALLVTRDRAFRATSPRVEVKSKVGAGDSFLGGFLLAQGQGQDIEEALRLGMAAGTAAVMNEGTQLCQRQDVERLMSQVHIELINIPPKPVLRKHLDTPTMDAVCGMHIDPALGSFSAVRDGREYRFCSLKCQRRFEKDPSRYAFQK